MKNLFFSVVLILLSTSGYAQKNSSIRGILKDSTDQPLVGASALLYFRKDSVLTGFSITDDSGAFFIKNVSPSEYYLQLNYVGHETYKKQLVKKDFTGEIDLKTVKLKSITDLEEIVVRNAPLEVKKDTIIYDALVFKTEENATVEDLLKKLPGVEVEEDGTITAQGETVKKVLVDGKKFFSDDPKMATQNLPAEAIDQVEVYDKQSEKAEFTGVDDGKEEKTINLKLKEDHKKGFFGNVSAGVGGDENRKQGLYTAKGMLSRFSPKNQLSFIVSGNNVNNQAFSYGDYFKMSGQTFGKGSMVMIQTNSLPIQNLSNGINQSSVLGANFGKTFSEKLELHGDYFLTQGKNRFDSQQKRTYFQEENNVKTTSTQTGINSNQNHNLNLDLVYRINENNELTLNNQVRFSTQDNYSSDLSTTRSFKDEQENQTNRTNETDGKNIGTDSNLFWKHNFTKEGRSIFTNLGYQQTITNQDIHTNALTKLLKQNRTEQLNQLIQNDYNFGTLSADVAYTEPIRESGFIELSHITSSGNEKRDKDYFNRENNQLVENADLSNLFKRNYTNHKSIAKYMILGNKHDITLGLSYENEQLKGNSSSQTSIIKKTFQMIAPVLNWEYQLKEGKQLSLNYWPSLNTPMVEQLQPVIDNTNPLIRRIGNPNLKAEKSHGINLNYNAFDRFTFTNLFIYGRASITKNKIIQAQSYDDNLIQTLQPRNVDQELRSDLSVSFGKPIRAIRMRLRARVSADYTNGNIYLNSIENNFNRLGGNLSIGLSNTNQEKVKYSISGLWRNSNTIFSQQKEKDQTFTSQNYSAKLNYKGIEHWNFGTEFNYSLYMQQENLQQTIPQLNASIRRSFAEKKGSIRLAVNDILNKNTGISQTQNLNYNQETNYNAIGRNGMLSLSWKIMSKKKTDVVK